MNGPDQPDTGIDEGRIIAERRGKLAGLRGAGNPYPNDFRRDALAGELHKRHGSKDNAELEAEHIRVAVAGRMMLKRVMGKACFATLQDMSGRIQLYVTLDGVGADVLDAFKHWDLGDIVGATGTLFRTKTGELSVKCDRVRLLAKALRPLPEKFHGMTDQEQRYRQRYVDLITNPVSRDVFVKRSQTVQAIREFFVARGFLEVETPMMQPIPGGAAARPFVTHHNALDMDLYLRIAPELYLKRLTVGGVERVFEINRNFRNEGISTRHNPEFTMLEFYWAYVDYERLMSFTEELLSTVAMKVVGTTELPYGEHTINMSAPFKRISLRHAAAEEASKRLGVTVMVEELRSLDSAKQIASKLGVEVPKGAGAGKIASAIFESLWEANLIQPTFVYDFPTEVSPLSKQRPDDPDTVERFELYIGGFEVANAFSELNDPVEQRRRFEAQLADRAAGDQEAHAMDEDYVRALEYGMPPAGGEGIGIDRLVQVLSNSPSIRDVILFPLMRPERD